MKQKMYKIKDHIKRLHKSVMNIMYQGCKYIWEGTNTGTQIIIKTVIAVTSSIMTVIIILPLIIIMFLSSTRIIEKETPNDEVVAKVVTKDIKDNKNS